MQKVLAAIVASTFALGTATAFAKQEELTSAQRADMRARADQLAQARASGTERMNTEATPATDKHMTKTKKTTKNTKKKTTTQ